MTVDDEDDPDFRGWSRPGPPQEDRNLRLALLAAETFSDPVRARMKSYMKAGCLAPGSWASRKPGEIRSRDRNTESYLRRLDDALIGPGAERLEAFLNRMLVESQALAFHRLHSDEDPGERPGWEDQRDGENWDDWWRRREKWVSRPGNVSAYLPGSRNLVGGAGEGRRFRCPFHLDRTASMAFRIGDRTCHCYGCGVQTTVWAMTARILWLSDREAVDMLRLWAGLPKPPWPLPATRRNPVYTVYGHIMGDRPPWILATGSAAAT